MSHNLFARTKDMQSKLMSDIQSTVTLTKLNTINEVPSANRGFTTPQSYYNTTITVKSPKCGSRTVNQN